MFPLNQLRKSALAIHQNCIAAKAANYLWQNGRLIHLTVCGPWLEFSQNATREETNLSEPPPHSHPFLPPKSQPLCSHTSTFPGGFSLQNYSSSKYRPNAQRLKTHLHMRCMHAGTPLPDTYKGKTKFLLLTSTSTSPSLVFNAGQVPRSSAVGLSFRHSLGAAGSAGAARWKCHGSALEKARNSTPSCLCAVVWTHGYFSAHRPRSASSTLRQCAVPLSWVRTQNPSHPSHFCCSPVPFFLFFALPAPC